jgi:glutamyl-tRNA reductase
MKTEVRKISKGARLVDLVLVGLNHGTAGIDVREKLTFSGEEAGALLSLMSGDERTPELLLLSTCNRTELYGRVNSGNCEGSAGSAELMREILLREKNVSIEPGHFYYRQGLDAARHLFRVSAGLDSMIMGESQILGQIKEAYRLACASHTAGFLVNKLFHTAFRVGSRARSQTEIGAGAVSVSMAAVELSQKIFRDLGNKRALVIGAGEMATLTAEHFISKKIGKLSFTNRTMSKAEELASRFGGQTEPWADLVGAIAHADVVVVSTRAQDYLVNANMMREAMHRRKNRPVFLIDIAVPRNIEPAVSKMYNVFSHNIDDLKQIIDRNLTRRKAEVPKVEKIIEEEIERFATWHGTLAVAPTIKSLIRNAERIRQGELQRNRGAFTEEQLKEVDVITRAFMNKMLHQPIMKIKEYGEDSETSLQRIDAVREIFNLEDETAENEE